MKSRARKLLTATAGVGSVSYVVGCSDGGLTSGNLVAPPYWPDTTSTAGVTSSSTADTSRDSTTDDTSTRDVEHTSSSTAHSAPDADTPGAVILDADIPDADIPEAETKDADAPDGNIGPTDRSEDASSNAGDAAQPGDTARPRDAG